MPPIQAIIPVTPGSGLDLDAVSLTIGLNTVYRETMVIADPSNATQLAGVTVGGALQVDASATTQPIIGTLTSNNAAPDGHNIGVLPAVANAIHPTYTEGDIVLLSTDLTGALRVSITGTILATNNIEQWNSVALGSPTAFGTEPSGNVIGVNAEVFQGSSVVGAGNALYVQFPSAQAVTQSTSPWVVAGGGTAGTAATGVLTVQGIAAMTPLLVTATFSAPQHVIVDSGTLTTVSTVTAVTSITNPVAVTGTFFQATQPVSIASGQVASGAFASGSIASGAIASGAIASGAIAAGAAAAGAFADGSVFVRSNAASTFPVTASIVGHAGVTLDAVLGATKPANVLQVGGNDGTNAYAIPLASGGASVLVSGTVSIGSGPFTVVGNLTNNNAAPSTNNIGALTVLANAATPTWTEGDLVTASADLAGNMRVLLHAETTKVIGTIRATGNIGGVFDAVLGAAIPANAIQVGGSDGTDLRALLTSNTGQLHVLADSGSTTAVTGVVEVSPTGAANTKTNPFFTEISDGTNTVTTNSTATSGKFGLDTNILSILGTAPTTAGFLDIKGADGNVFVRQTTASNLNATVVGTLTNNNAAPTTTNIGALMALANAAVPTFTEGDQVLASVDLSGHLRVVATGAAAVGAAASGNPVFIAGIDNSSDVRALSVTVQGSTALSNVLLVGGKNSNNNNAYPINIDSNGTISILDDAGGFTDAIAQASIGQFYGGTGVFLTAQVAPVLFNGSTWDRARSAGVGNAVAATGLAAAVGYVQYNTTLPAPTAGQYTAAQCDTTGSTYVNMEGRKATYSAFASFTAVAGDIAVLPGSASKTIRVIRVEVSFVTSGVAAIEAVQLIKRSAADTSGTSAAMTAVPHDSNFAAASAAPLNYTVAPTPGAAVGTIRGVQFNDASSSVPGANTWIWDFGARPSSAIVLRGVAQMLCIALPTAVATQTATVSFEWTEE